MLDGFDLGVVEEGGAVGAGLGVEEGAGGIWVDYSAC